MCLSRVYLNKKGKNNLLIEEVSNVAEKNGVIEVSTVFGDTRKLKGYVVKEVDLTENYLVLRRKKNNG